ncbi:MAG: type IV fimbrial biogenesis protein FimT [Gammaproteobacteria bacterium]|jgi:type IV fimbrial biogenesis protein FimT
MKKSSGFTLLELIITVGIIGVVTAIAFPAMGVYIQNNRLTTQINALVSHLAYARNEAVSRSIQTVLCASPDSLTCAGTAWANGWIVFGDADASGQIDGTEAIQHVQPALTGTGITLTTTIAGGQVIYDNRGFAATLPGTFSLCDNRRGVDASGAVDHIGAIEISITGRVRQVQDAEGPTC